MPRAARWLVGIVLAALIVPGVIGFEAWPLTGWRLFSLSRTDTQNRWIIQAVDATGEPRTISLEDLPLGYRHAEWPLADLPGASDRHREDVCRALLEAVLDLTPDTQELRIAKDHQRLVEESGDWTVTHDPEVLHTCRA